MLRSLALTALLALLSAQAADACLCQLRSALHFRCSSAKCYDERVANDFCRSDFCVEASVRSERQLWANASLAAYHFRPVRVLRFTPASLAAIKTSLVWTPADSQDCGVQLKRGSIYFFCGQMMGQKAVVTACHYVKRTETLNLAERSFFISGYKKTNCFPNQQSPFGKPLAMTSPRPSGVNLAPIHAPIIASNFIPKPVAANVSLPTLRPQKTTQRPSTSTTTPLPTPTPTTTTTTTTVSVSDSQGPPGPPGSPQNGDYFCLLVPINALALNRFLKHSQAKDGAAVDPTGQYVLYCPNQFFCIPQTSQLEAMANITALDVRGVDDMTELERAATDEFKALMPKPLLPMCRDFNETTFVVPPWLVPALSVLQTADGAPPPCSDNSLDVDCDLNTTVTLADGTVITASPLQEPPVPTAIQLSDGTTIAITVGQESRVTAADGTEATISADGSSKTTLPDGSRVTIGADKNVALNMSDGAVVVFNQNGMTVRLPDKTLVVTSEYGMVVTTADGNNTLIPVDSNGAEIHSSSSEIVVTEGLNAEIRSVNGTQVLITPTDTTVGARDGSTTNVLPDGTVTVSAPGGLALTFAVDAYVNVTTPDGTVASIGQDDSLYVINEMECIVVFPNGNEMIVTKDEIISLESDGQVTVTDALGSNAALPLDASGAVCQDFSCLESQ